jgi:hypothetical protein
MGSEPLFEQPNDEIPPVASFPPGFHQILLSLGINDQAARFIHDAKTTTLIRIFSGYEGTTDAELFFSNAHCHSIIEYLDHMSSHFMITDTRSPAQQHLLLQECLCLGILAYRMMMLRSIPPDPCFSFDAGNRLKASLMKTQLQPHWEGQFELLFWISFQGPHTAAPGPLREFYVLMLSGIRIHLRLRSWGQTKYILKKFLWIERCEMLGNVLWSEVESFGVGSTSGPLGPFNNLS